MYLEFILVITDYFKTIRKLPIILYEWILPLIIFFICNYFGSSVGVGLFAEIKNSVINIIGVLLGFSIAIMAIITTGSSENLEEIKNIETEIIIGEDKISLYRLVLINFSYTVVIEIIFILLCLLTPILNRVLLFDYDTKIILYSIMIFISTHILLLTLRNITDFYLIITKNDR